MSAPDTNIEKQKKRHAGPLVGIAAGIAFVAVLLVIYLVTVSGSGDELPGPTAMPQEDTETAAPATN